MSAYEKEQLVLVVEHQMRRQEPDVHAILAALNVVLKPTRRVVTVSVIQRETTTSNLHLTKVT